jgi:hypothetical protein
MTRTPQIIIMDIVKDWYQIFIFIRRT